MKGKSNENVMKILKKIKKILFSWKILNEGYWLHRNL